MLVGIIANITKESVLDVVSSFITKLNQNKIQYLLTNSILESGDKLTLIDDKGSISEDEEIFKRSDIIISVGGDGTMLATAHKAHLHDKPV